MISQAFSVQQHSSPFSKFECNGTSKRNDMKSAALRRMGGAGSKQMNGFLQFADDWQETGTFTAALERVESWIFSRLVESVWWQVMGQCVARLDVAMFNAILYESVHWIPTDLSHS
ncbi:hypothetical protein ACLB2K_059737 [Fragaria x ananassa]